MGVYLSAGTYVVETDLSQVAAAVSTSVAATVSDFPQGPVNIPVIINNPKQFVQVFGKPSQNTYLTAYCALAFLNQSNQLYVVRASSSVTPPAYAGLLLQTGNTANTSVFTSFSGVTNPNLLNMQVAIAPATAPTQNLAYFYRIGPGSYGNSVAISITSDNAAPPSVNILATTGTLPAGTYSYIVAAVKSIGNNPAGQIISSPVSTTVTANGGVSLTWAAINGATSYNVYGRSGSNYYLIAQVPTGTSSQFYNTFLNAYWFTDTGSVNPAIQYQTAAGNLYAYPAGTSPITAPTSSTTTDVFTVNVFDSSISVNTPQESWEVSLDNSTSLQGQQQQIATVINTLSSYINVVENPAYGSTVVYPAPMTYLTNGVDGAQPSASDIALQWNTQFSNTENITVRLLIEGGIGSPVVQTAMDTLAHTRGDCVAILDMPTLYQKTTDAVMYRNTILNLNSNRSAIYSPDLYIDDIYNGGILFVPPSGHVAGVYAYNDYVAQAWFAPAGLNRGILNIRGLRYIYAQADRDILAPAQINYMRNFPGQGVAVWEALTLQAKTSALTYINVRRLMDVVEVSLKEALLYQVWEPDDDFLRRQIVGLCTEFLEIIKRKRGINNYTVICDGTNNPPALTATGQLNVDIYIEPTLPAQKIQIQGIITQQGASFNELIASGT